MLQAAQSCQLFLVLLLRCGPFSPLSIKTWSKKTKTKQKLVSPPSHHLASSGGLFLKCHFRTSRWQQSPYSCVSDKGEVQFLVNRKAPSRCLLLLLAIFACCIIYHSEPCKLLLQISEVLRNSLYFVPSCLPYSVIYLSNDTSFSVQTICQTICSICWMLRMCIP